LFWGGAWVAFADGHLADSEAENLRQQAGDEMYEQGMAQLNDTANPLEFARTQFNEAVRPLLSMGASDRCSFIQKLVVVARADQNVDDSELDALAEMAKTMKVEPSFVQQILMFLD